MNRRIGRYTALVNIAAVIIFAASMLIGNTFAGYTASLFIAISFVAMMSAFCFYSSLETKLSGYICAGFSIVYAAINALVYFAQMTSVRMETLTGQASRILDFQQFGLFFNYDMLGYAFMSLATFFAGLTVNVKTRSDKWLKALLLVHGIFFITCFFLPLLGVFQPDMQGSSWIGTVILEFWCIYFIPIGILSYRHFSKMPRIA